MQKPIFFEHEQVQPKNLNFLNSSVEKNIKDAIVTFTNGVPGIVQGLTLSGISGSNVFTVSQGYGYNGDGERIQVYSGTNVYIDFSGTKTVYLTYGSVSYNPDPSENPSGASNIVVNINPDDGSQVAVESYNFPVITTSSGSGYVTLGTVTADGGMLFTNASASGATNLLIGGVIDINSQTINGLNLASGSVDSSLFTNPLTYDLFLGTDVDINLVNSGNNNIGSTATPLANVYAVTGNFHEINGMSPIRMDSIWQKTGTSLEAIGNNFVAIDNNQLGTRFGNGVTIGSNYISTTNLDKDINISTDPAKSVNIDSTLNVTSGHNLYVKDNLYVSGTAFLGTTNIVGSTGNFSIAGELSYSSVNQGYDNLVRNSSFAIPSGNITGTVTYPANWNLSVPNRDFAYGPITNGAEFLRSPASLNSIMAVLGTTGNYTIEVTLKKFANSLFGDTTNRIWTKFSTNTNYSTNFFLSAATPAAVGWSSNAVPMNTGAVIKNNQWYHIAYTWDGVKRRIYIDGTEVLSDFSNGSFQGGDIAEQRIAAFGTNGANFNGLITSLAVSNFAKTTFPSGSAPLIIPTSGTLGYWKFENNLLDSTPNARNLVQVGVATGTFSDSGLGQVFSGTIAGTGTEAILSPGEQNVYISLPHTSSFLLGSGLNIDVTGISISQPMPDLKPNTSYALSYYTKNFNAGASGLAISTSISGTVAGTGNITQLSITSPAPTFNSTSWSKQVYNFATPPSGSNFNLNLGVYSNSTGTVATGVFGLAGFQITEGPAIVPYKKKENVQIISISDQPQWTTDFPSGAVTTATIPGYGRTFYTKGGLCVITANLGVGVMRLGGAGSVDVDYRVFMYLDNRLVSTALNILPYSMANTIGTGYMHTGNGNLSFTTYLEPGFHTLRFDAKLYAGGSGITWISWRFFVFDNQNSNVSIAIFE